MTSPDPRRMPARLAAPLLALAAWTALPASAAPAIDVGEPSVLSQQGQRLKLAIPYGSEPGQPVSVSRFEVVAVESVAGFPAPAPSEFTISAPARRNVVFLQSRRPFDAPELTLTVRIADQPDSAQTWRLGVPPALASEPPVAAANAQSAPPTVRATRRAPPVGQPGPR